MLNLNEMHKGFVRDVSDSINLLVIFFIFVRVRSFDFHMRRLREHQFRIARMLRIFAPVYIYIPMGKNIISDAKSARDLRSDSNGGGGFKRSSRNTSKLNELYYSTFQYIFITGRLFYIFRSIYFLNLFILFYLIL